MEVMVSGTVPEGAGLSVGNPILSKGLADSLQLELGGFCCRHHRGIPCRQWFTGRSEQGASCGYCHGRRTPLGAQKRWYGRKHLPLLSAGRQRLI